MFAFSNRASMVRVLIPALIPLIPLSAHAANITPTSVTSSIGQLSPSYAVSHLIDGSGLSAGINPASTEGATFSDMWLGIGTTAILTFNLGASYDVTSATLWNYNYTNNLTRGAQTFDVSISADGGAYTSALIGNTLIEGTGASGLAGQTFSLPVTASFIQIALTRNYGAAAVIGLGEVLFQGTAASTVMPAVPEPASLALILSGLGAIGVIRAGNAPGPRSRRPANKLPLEQRKRSVR